MIIQLSVCWNKIPMQAINLIDSDCNFNDDVKNALIQWEIINKGCDYRIVSIMGCQSSGKSTLLNLLFGTKFDVMDHTIGISQTTVGINLAKAFGSEILVMDLEGTDSRERAEAGTNFERKLALFSLAISDVLMINLWYTDIGRYNASNYSLLKNIFEISLNLFDQRKTKLMFIVRDHTNTPINLLEKLIKNDMNIIWNQIEKTHR